MILLAKTLLAMKEAIIGAMYITVLSAKCFRNAKRKFEAALSIKRG